jgi:photosystem II stability/assembly factor-like uncharacterized protein
MGPSETFKSIKHLIQIKNMKNNFNFILSSKSRTFILTIFYMFNFQPSFGQGTDWEFQNPKPNGSSFISAIHSSGQNQFSFVNVKGYVYYSNNGTNYSNSMQENKHNLFPFAQYLSQNEIAGYNILQFDQDLNPEVKAYFMTTTDGGVNWKKGANIFDPSIRAYQSFFMSSINNGFLTGDSGKIFKTTDGGLTWIKKSTNTLSKINGVHLMDNTVGFACGKNVTLKTINGGETWTPKIQIFDVKNIYAKGLNELFIVSEEISSGDHTFKLRRSTDDGASWTVLVEITLDDIIYRSKIKFIDSNYGFLLIDNKVWKTIDGGSNWSLLNIQNIFQVNDIHFFDGSNGYIVGDKGEIIKTSNGGANWESLNDKAVTNFGDIFFRDIAFSNPNRGAIVGDSGLFIRTTNAGQNWLTYGNKKRYNITSMTFQNSQLGFYSTSDGSIFKTTNQGDSWDSLGKKSNGAFSAINFFSPSTGIGLSDSSSSIVGDRDLLLRTTNGGSNWQPDTLKLLGKTSFFGEICIIDEFNGVISTGYEILKTSNSGISWSKIFKTSPDTGIITGVHFPNSNVGYFISCDPDLDNWSSIWKTSNGGVTWARIKHFNFSSNLFDVKFINENEGYVCGGFSFSSIILKTIDGGLTWSFQNNPSKSYWIQNLCIVSPDTIYATDLRSQEILRTTNGGETVRVQPIYSLNPLLLYPNPSQNFVHFKSRSLIKTVQIFDFLGKSYPVSPLVENRLDISGLRPGLYLFQVQTAEGIQTHKFLKD